MTEQPKFTSAQEAVSSWEKVKLEDRQKHWQMIFQTGEMTPYDRNIKAPKFDAVGEAFKHPGDFFTHLRERTKQIDYELRGGKDIGGLNVRMERVFALAGLSSMFWAFDYLTGPVFKNEFGRLVPVTQEDPVKKKALVAATQKFVSVLNDKYASDLSNLLVDKLTGVRSGFNHQIADKGADTLNTGFVESLDDKMNAPMIESGLRIMFQIPVVGALIEQGAVRLTNFQEKSSIHTNFGKMNYMALGTYINVMRSADAQKKAMDNRDMIHKWIDERRPDAAEAQRTIANVLTSYPRVKAEATQA